MKEAVENFLKTHNILNENETYIVAFSGGFDSMCLADILVDLSLQYKFRVILAHLNHNWRGEKSLTEAKNCENFAKEKNVEFYSEMLDESIPHTETVAREKRYEFFIRAAKKFNSDKIFTAHTKSDNVETVLQRIIKGTGIEGLQGIRPIREIEDVCIYRPFLEFSRKDILNYCKEKNLNPNNDNSNKDTKYFRNKIRENLLPELKTNYDQNVEEAICRLIQNAKESENLLKELEQEKFKQIVDNDKILTKEFQKLPCEMQKRIVKNLLKKNNFDYDQKRINEILNFIKETSSSKSGKTFSLTTDYWLFVNDKKIEITNKTQYNSDFVSTEINIDGITLLPEFNACIKITKWQDKKPSEFPKDTDNVVFADLSNIELPLTLRTRTDGDKIIPFGQHTPVKLKKYLNNKKISKHEKSKLLLISSPKEVLWVINMGISNSIRVKSMPTHKIEFLYKE